MAQLRQYHEKFIGQGVEIVVVGPENAKKFKKYFAEHSLPFIGLPDPKRTVLRQYGQEFKIFKFGRMPAQLLVDKEGVARFVHYGKSMSDIPPADEMLALVGQIRAGESPEDNQ